MKRFKTVLSIVLAFMMVFSVIPMTGILAFVDELGKRETVAISNTSAIVRGYYDFPASTANMAGTIDYTNSNVTYGTISSVDDGVTNYKFIEPVTHITEVPEGYIGISNADELNNIRNSLSQKYILMSNIDLAEISNWMPIDNFNGVLDGNGYEISNLNVNTTEYIKFSGLFGNANNAIIKNVALTNSIFTMLKTDVFGCIAAKGNPVNCIVSAEINLSSGTVGGIVGNGKAEKCYFVGRLNNNALRSSSYGYCGGIIGNGTASYCYNEGEIIQATFDSNFSSSVGGIAGAGTVEQCYNSGTVSSKTNGSYSSSYCGGIVGLCSTVIKNSFNIGNLSSISANYSAMVGGICGDSITGAKIDCCYNIGELTCSTYSYSSIARYKGGIIGLAEATVTLTNCYYLDNVSAIAGRGSVSSKINTQNVSDMSLGAFGEQTSFHNFNFNQIWTMQGNINYVFPELKNMPMFYQRQDNNSLSFNESVIILYPGETYQIIAYKDGVTLDNALLEWKNYYNSVISLSNDGVVEALEEGVASVWIYSKENPSQCAQCLVYVGNPNSFNYTTTYDTKQYYADGGFYSSISSISDCVEIYYLLKNKIADALEYNVPQEEYGSKLKDISPITLTATVSGKDLSFSRDSYQNTYIATFDSISAGKAVDDILMLFPHNLSISPTGNTYTVTVTLQSDSFDTITEKYTFTVENLANKSANEHISFVSSNAAYLDSKDNRYGQQMVTLKNDVEYKWSKYSSLDFENYYEVVFADVLVGLMDTAQLGHVSLLPVVKEWVGNYKTILSSVSTMVEDNYTGYLDVSENAIDKLLKKSKYITEGIHTDDELYQTVVDLLGNTGNAEKITKAFAAIDKTKQYHSFFKLGVNITNDIVDFVNGASVLNSYKDMDDEFKAVVNNLYNQIPSSEKKLKDAVYHYVNVDSYLGYSEELFNAVRDMAGDITLDIFKSIYKKQVVSSLCKVIGNITLKSGALLSSTSAFSGVSTALGAFTTGWTLGTCVSDILCNNSGKSAEMSKVIAMSEFSPYIINTLNHYESKLYSDRNNTAVAEFEYAFAMHKAAQSYIMARTVRSLEIKRDSLIIKLFSRDDYDGLISDILADKQSIENLKCHTDENAETVVSQTKVVAVKCPVDVFIYDEKGNEVVRIVNNNKEYVASGLSVFVGDNEKYIALPANQNYQIKIVATDQGTMEYFVTEYDNGAVRERTVETLNIPLCTQRVFIGEVAKEMDVAPESYALSYDNEQLLPNNIVEVPISGVSLNISGLNLSIGETSRLTATVMPTNVTNAKVKWYSDDPSVAVVDANGTVTAISAGTTTIWVVTEDWGYMAACTVTVIGNSLKGDLNGDGKITAVDARWALQAASGTRPLSNEQKQIADVNGDRQVTAVDARWILQAASGTRQL